MRLRVVLIELITFLKIPDSDDDNSGGGGSLWKAPSLLAIVDEMRGSRSSAGFNVWAKEESNTCHVTHEDWKSHHYNQSKGITYMSFNNLLDPSSGKSRVEDRCQASFGERFV